MKRHQMLQWIVAIASVLAAAIAAFGQSGARLPADLDPDSRARLPYLQRKDLDAKSQAIVDPELDVVRLHRRIDHGFDRPVELSAGAGDVVTTALLPGLELPLENLLRV